MIHRYKYETVFVCEVPGYEIRHRHLVTLSHFHDLARMEQSFYRAYFEGKPIGDPKLSMEECDEIITFHRWNIPHSIMIKDLIEPQGGVTTRTMEELVRRQLAST
jgi:hypothetical protein